MTKAIAYYRVSTSSQSTENQKVALREVVARQGWNLVTELEDFGISGTTNDRPAFTKLNQMVARKECDLVVVWSLDRLGRSMEDLIRFLNDLQKSGIDLYSHTQAINTQTSMGRMVFGILASLSQWENEFRRERIIAGLDRAKKEGKKLGRPTNVNDAVRASVSVMRSKGYSIVQIAKTLKIGVGTTRNILAIA